MSNTPTSDQEPTKCSLCGEVVTEYCSTLACRACHKTISFEDCVGGKAQSMADNGRLAGQDATGIPELVDRDAEEPAAVGSQSHPPDPPPAVERSKRARREGSCQPENGEIRKALAERRLPSATRHLPRT